MQIGNFNNQFLNDLSNAYIANDNKDPVKNLSKAEVKALQSRTVVAEFDVSSGVETLRGMKTIPEPGWFGRSKQNCTDNNRTRQLFLASVLEECDVHPSDPSVKLSDLGMGELKALAKQSLPPRVLSVLKLNDYGSRGRPLSVFRMRTVLAAISMYKDVDQPLDFYKNKCEAELNDAIKYLNPDQQKKVKAAIADLTKRYLKTTEFCFASLANVAPKNEFEEFGVAVQTYHSELATRFDENDNRVVKRNGAGRTLQEIGLDMVMDFVEEFYPKDKGDDLNRGANRLNSHLKDTVQWIEKYALFSTMKKHPALFRYCQLESEGDMVGLSNPTIKRMSEISRRRTWGRMTEEDSSTPTPTQPALDMFTAHAQEIAFDINHFALDKKWAYNLSV